MAWNYKILPDGYQQVEYLQTDGNAYIDTGFKPYYSDVSTRITGVFEYTEPKTPGSLLGSSGYNKKYFYIRNPLYRDGIPEEYQQVEYIKSSESQYIDTGILKDDTGNNTLVIKMQVEFTAIPSSEQVFAGVRSGNDRISISILSSGKLRFNSGTGYTDSSTTVSTGVIYDIEGIWANGKQTLKLNDEVIITRTQNGSSINNITIHLFECNYSTKYLFTAGQIYNTQIIVNDELIRDFVSCYRKTDNTGGFYDLITEEFYESAGTGNFVCGDIVPEEILDDPTVVEDGAFLFGLKDVFTLETSFSNQHEEFELPGSRWDENHEREYCDITHLSGETAYTVSGSRGVSYDFSYEVEDNNLISLIQNSLSVKGVTYSNSLNETIRLFDISEITLEPGKYKLLSDENYNYLYIAIYDTENNEIVNNKDGNIIFDIFTETLVIVSIILIVNSYLKTERYQDPRTGAVTTRYIQTTTPPSGDTQRIYNITPSIHCIEHVYEPEKFTVNMDNNNCKFISITNTGSASFDESPAFELDENLLIFAANKYGFIDYVNQSTRIYSLKIYKGPVIYHSYIPCYLKIDGTPGLYDTISKTFLVNANEIGSFSVGQDIIPNKEEGTLITGRSVETSTEYAYLPDEYQQLEYIQATGTQYIMSNYYPNEGTKIVGKFMLPEKSIYGTTYLFGERSSYHGPSSWELSYDAKERMLIADIGRTTVNTIKIANGAIVEFELSATKALLNTKSESIHESVGGISRYMLYIFGTNVSDTVMMMSPVRLYSFKIIEGDELVANYIPCYRKSDLLGGLYDVVNKIFYFDWSDKKIPFTKGPIVFPPVLKDISKTDLYLEVYDSNFNQLAVIDEYMSLIWSDRYDECGDFELQIPYDEDLLNDILKMDNFCKINLSDRCMIIEKIQYDIDEDDNETVIVSGRSAESLLERRVVLKEKSFGDEANNKKVEIQTIMKTLIEENIISPTDESRKISNFKFLENPLEEFTKMKVYDSYCGEDLYTIINSLCSEKRIGFKVTIDDRNDFTFSIYKGIDRTYDQKDNEYVVFSPYYDNLKNSSFFSSSEEFKNFMAVSKTTNEYLEVFNETNPPIGITRKEIYVNKSDLTKNGSSSISDKKAKRKAKKKLSVDYAIKKGFEGDIVPDTMFYYRVDYFIGDHVQLEDKHGHSYPVYISEIVITKNQNGLTVIPTFKEIEKEWDTPEGE